MKISIILFTAFGTLILSGCGHKQATASEDQTVHSGTIRLSVGRPHFRSGFDFSDELSVMGKELLHTDVDQIDLYTFAHDSTLYFVGSPVLYIDEDTITNRDSYRISADSSMPGIMSLDGNSLNAIKELTETGFEFKLKIHISNVFERPVFAVKTQDFKYAIFEITDFDRYIITIDWKYQSDGSRTFN